MTALESRSLQPVPDYTNVTVLGAPVAVKIPEDGNEPLPCPACGQTVTMITLWGHAGCLDSIYWQETVALREAL